MHASALVFPRTQKFVILRRREGGKYLGLVLDRAKVETAVKGLMKIHEGSLRVIVKYSVLQIMLCLLYLTGEIETNSVGTCSGYTYVGARYALRDCSQ